jgi:hypothetical protein
MTPLEKILRRALKINGADYVLTISPQGLKLTLKKKRNGLELAWADLVDGEAALATALNASLGQLDTVPKENVTRKSPPPRKHTNATTNGRPRRVPKPS